jgi:hypothetical protein
MIVNKGKEMESTARERTKIAKRRIAISFLLSDMR